MTQSSTESSSLPPINNDLTEPRPASSTSLTSLPANASFSSSLPPPLPSRDRRVGSMPGVSKSASSLLKQSNGVIQNPSQLDMYYAHLQKHVRVVKRKNPHFMPIPCTKNFQKTLGDDGTTSTDWLEYLKAWIDYIIQSAASDRIDDQLEPFSYEIMKSGCDRLYRLGMPLMEPMKNIVRIYEWQNVSLTGGIFSAYLFLWWMDLLAVFLCIGLALFVASVRLQSFVVLGMEAVADDMDDDQYDDQVQNDGDTLTGMNGSTDDENDGDGDETSKTTGKTKKNKNKKNWRKRFGRATSDIFTLSYSGCEALGTTPAPESKSVKEWRTEITTNYGPTAQLLVLDLVDKLERMKNLVTWKRPAKTRALLVLLVVGAFGLFYIPYGYITKSLFFWIGMEFFVLQYLRTTFPRYRRLFNIIDWILWGVPNDAQYAMEVIRHSRHTTPLEQNDVPAKRQQQHGLAAFSKTPSTSSPSPPSSPLQQQQQGTAVNQQQDREIKPFAGDRSASLPELPSTKTGTMNENDDIEEDDKSDSRSNKSNDNSVESSAGERKKYGKAISTTATLATMMASTAVGQFKQLIDDKLDKDVANKENEKKPARALKDKNRPSYGCMYQGSIPGRLFILEKGFQFRSSRLTGAKLFVDYDWQDLVSVRKTKSMDAFVFHTNGLDIHLSDGQVLSFDNVIKRDECFTNLVSSGEHW